MCYLYSATSIKKEGDEMSIDKDDLSKRHLSIVETQILASNLNRIEDARKLQREHTDIDFIVGLIGGIAMIPMIVLGAIIMFRTCGDFIQGIFNIVIIVGATLLDVWYIRLSWRFLTGKM